MSKLGHPTRRVVAEIDEKLSCWFVPKRPNQVFPTASQIRRRVRDIARVLDDSVAFRDTRKKNRYSILTRGQRAFLELEVDSTVGVVIHELIKETARKHEVSMADAMVLLLSGTVEPEAQQEWWCILIRRLMWRGHRCLFRAMGGVVRIYRHLRLWSGI